MDRIRKFTRQEEAMMQAFAQCGDMLSDDDLKQLGYDPTLDINRLSQVRHRLKNKLKPFQTINVDARGSKKSNLNPVLILVDLD